MKLQTWCDAFKCFLVNFMKKDVQSWKRDIKLLLETVTYIAKSETITCITYCRKYHLHNCNRESHLHNYKKNYHHIVAAETFTGISAAETSNCMIATEIVTCMIATGTSTNITDRKYHRIARDVTCIIAIERVICIAPKETVTGRLTTETFTCRNGTSQRSF